MLDTFLIKNWTPEPDKSNLFKVRFIGNMFTAINLL
jgi:hypothetical protein